MKLLLIAALAVCAFGRSLNDDVALFADFRATYGRSYAPTEEAQRFDCFRKTLSNIDELNAREPHAFFGINAFSDLCADEFKAMYHNARPANYTGPRRSFPVKAPTPVDWRQKGAVTHVKNQAQCGSCWTFSAVGNLEGQHFLNGGGKLVGLSEEELVQCAKSAGNGCQGGWMDKAIEWVVQNGGIDSESDYPYTSGHGVNGRCNEEKAAKHVATFSKMSHIAQNEAEIASALNSIGPLSIGVDAQSGWQSYRGGVMTTCRGTSIDHGVTLVGYGGTGEGYWIVKNSWGTSWGESGYIRLAYGSDQCGMRQTVATGHV